MSKRGRKNQAERMEKAKARKAMNGYHSEKWLKDHRRWVFGLLAAGALGIWEAKTGRIRNGIENLFTDEKAVILKDMEGLTLPFLDANNPAIANVVAEKQKSYGDVAYQLDRVEVEIARFKGYSDSTPRQREAIQKVNQAVLASGIIGDLRSLRSQNDRRNSGGRLVLIPQSHFHSSADKLENEKSANCAKEIEGIVRAHRILSPAIFPEGMRMEGRLSLDSFAASLGIDPTLVRDESEKEAMRDTARDLLREYGNEWVLDSSYRVFGAEHRRFMPYNEAAVTRIASSNGEIMGAYSKYYLYVINGLIREQYMIEKAVSQMKDGETGIVIMGGAHVPTMERYAKERFKNLKCDVIVPRHLF